MYNIFKNNGLSINIEAKYEYVDFFDVTLNLSTGTYKPYKKPNDTLCYIHAHSNHPPVVMRKLPQDLRFPGECRLRSGLASINGIRPGTRSQKPAEVESCSSLGWSIAFCTTTDPASWLHIQQCWLAN
ncbi:hypothetical protein ElyMa_004907600 [Elysia marginata]|uniref:Uncharacterized protein n=1 Tax=Elysia marginata TaxID=1093978 RepID=A0AAV4IZM3_9GAST|nr:hypothetical protein ElyMa_004907600 [Elysia marginata]